MFIFSGHEARDEESVFGRLPQGGFCQRACNFPRVTCSSFWAIAEAGITSHSIWWYMFERTEILMGQTCVNDRLMRVSKVKSH